jgi:tetratricopeptide (TPR) repeat protein
MINKSTFFVLVAILAACSNNFVSNDYLKDTRIPLAKTLEDEKKYAEALIQLRILQTAAPDNISIKAQVRRIESVISNRLIALFKQLGKTKNSSSEQQIRKIHLKILALTPNHNIAIEELRAYEWQYALEKAATKTQTIKEYFIENQVKAKRSIKLNQLLEQAEQFTQDRKYKDLLQLADKFEMAFPVNKKPAEFRLLAYTNLAERSIQKKDITMAISFFEKAIEIDNNQNTLLQTKNDGLKEQLAKSYMGLGLQVFKKDLDKAIDMFTLSLKYQPNNTAARQQLHRATRVRDNLNKIKKLNASSS